MVSLNDVLLAMSNIPVDDPIAETWGRGLQGGHEIIEYTGPLPITITADGTALIDYKIYGNTVQAGTPTPENPIMPEGVGELETAGTHAGQYKLPILSNSTVTNIYLGEVETTRRIKKLVLTGDESWRLNPTPPDSHSVMNTILYDVLSGISPICTHYTGSIDYQWASLPENHITTSIKSGNYIRLAVNVGTESLDDFKAYLAAQYAAGTPVTVWYVLAEPETGIVNEPLMKIGDYVDTLTMEQATVQIPTVTGTTVIDYDGTPKPSQMYIKYRR